MKKIVALILTLSLLMLALASCAVAGVDEVKACYANSNPTEIVVVSTQEFGTVLSTTTVIQSGYIINEIGISEPAAIKTVKGEALQTLEAGSGVDILDYKYTIDTTEYYVESKGVSSNFGASWDYSAPSFVPARGGMAISFDNTGVMKNATFDGSTMKFNVSAENAPLVFPTLETAIKADATVTITVAGGVVTSILVQWTIPLDSSTNVEEMNVSVKATYKYDLVNINMK
jgi:hypothetical protein